MSTQTPPVVDIGAIDPEVYARRWKILALLCTSLGVIIIGNTALNTALPTLSRELHASTSQLQWMVDSYALVFAGMLFTAGSLGDRFGRKGALQFGLVLFLGASIFAAFTHASGAVIAARAVMGFAAAFVMPATLSIIANVFPPQERAKAIALWSGISSAGGGLAPVISGFMLKHFAWGSVFLVNVPIIVGALIAGRVLLPKSRDHVQTRLDPLGAALSIAGLGALVYAIIEAPSHGWLSTESLVWFGAAAVLIAAFLLWEKVSAQPMLDLTLFRDRRFSASSFGITLVFFAMFGTFFLMSQYFQLVLGYDPLGAGLRQLPMPLFMMVAVLQTPKLVPRFGVNRVVSTGLTVLAFGMLILSRVGVGTPYGRVIVPMVIMAVGVGLTMAPMTASIMAAVPANRAGVGSAMNDTSRELGGALGVAVLGSIVASRYSSRLGSQLVGLPAAAANGARTSLAGALQVAKNIDGGGGAPLALAARRAYVSGFGLACAVCAAVLVCAAAGVYRFLPSSHLADED